MARNKPPKAEISVVRDKTMEAAKQSIWREDNKECPSWEIIRGSSFCAVRANIPNYFKEDTNE